MVNAMNVLISTMAFKATNKAKGMPSFNSNAILVLYKRSLKKLQPQAHHGPDLVSCLGPRTKNPIYTVVW